MARRARGVHYGGDVIERDFFGAVERLRSSGRPPGLYPGGGYTEERLTLGDGDSLFLFTDGIVEADGPEGEFGQSRIEAQVRASSGGGAKLLDGTLRAVHDFVAGAAIHDDLTMLTLRSK